MESCIQPISIVMRCYNEGEFIADTFQHLKNQNYRCGYKLIVIDSGSSDGSLEIIRANHPDKLIQIPLDSYKPGWVLNRGMIETQSDWVVFLNADAIPLNDSWLTELLKVGAALKNPGAVFGRQIPRSNCRGVYAHDYERCFGENRESATWDHFFSMVNSMVYRPVWNAFKFREEFRAAEDDEWSRRIKKAGYDIGYAERSIVIHSHNYTAKQVYDRAFRDAETAAFSSSVEFKAINFRYTILFSWIKDILRDFVYLKKHKKLREIPYAVLIRFFQRLGKYRGFHQGFKLYRN